MPATFAPSAREEYEITDLNHEYLRRGQLSMWILNRGSAWLDMGTHGSASFVEAIEKRLGLNLAAPEEIVCRTGHISME